MTQIHWTSAINAAFNVASFWSTGTVPGPLDDAIIDAVGFTAPVDYTVTSAFSQTVLSIQTNVFATLLVTGGGFLATAGTNGGVNAGAIQVNNAASFEFGGTFANTGLISIVGGANLTEMVIAGGGASLTGAGRVTIADNPNNEVFGAVGGTALTNVDNLISGAGQIGLGQLTLINDAAGVIEATGVNPLIVDTANAPDVNSGLMEALTGNLVLQVVTLDQSGGGILEAANGEVVSLENATLIGGTLETAGTGAIQTQSGINLLDGLTSMVNNVGLVKVLNSTVLEIEGAIYNPATVYLQGGANYTDLRVIANAALSGGGQVTLDDDPNNVVTATAVGVSLTNVDNVISGAGAFGGGQLLFVNDAGASLEATGTSNALVFNTGAQTAINNGLIEGLGSGGLTIVNSTIDQSGGGAIVSGGGSSVGLRSADIIGGVINALGGGLVETLDAGSILDGRATHPVTMLGTLTILNSSALTAIGTIDLGKTINGVAFPGAIDIAAGANFTDLSAGKASATVVGGAIVMADSANSEITGIVTGTTAVSSLTNRSFISGAGSIGTNLTLINDTTIEADGSNVLFIDTGNSGVAGSNTVANNGLLEAANPFALSATGGLRLVDGVIANALGKGVIEATGATTHVDLVSVIIRGGTLKTASGGVIQTLDAGSLLDGTAASVTNQGLIDLPNNTALTLAGSLDNLGQIDLLGAANFTDLVIAAAGATLSGAGQVILDDDPNNRIRGLTAGAVLTNIDNTISGAGLLGNAQLGLTNQAAGVIDATGATALTVNVGAAPIVNLGLFEATGSGGLTLAASTLDDSGGGLLLAGTGSRVALQTAHVIGGTLQSAGTGDFVTLDAGSVIDGGATSITLTGLIDIPNSTALTAIGTFNNLGTVAVLGGANFTDFIANNATLIGAGLIQLNDDPNNVIVGANATARLVNLNNTITGAGLLGDGQLILVNQAAGKIEATGTNALVLNTGASAVANAGLIEALGSGGLLIQATTVNDSKGGVLQAGAGSHVDLQNADLVGGTLRTVGSGDFRVLGGTNLLDGTTATVRNLGTVDILNSEVLEIAGTINNVGALKIDAGANFTDLLVSGAANLVGAGQVVLSDTPNGLIGGLAAGAVLTNVNDVISGAGRIGGGVLALTNAATGIIDANGTNALTLDAAGTVTNAGMIEATGTGGLVVSSTVNDAAGGTILAAAGSVVTLTGGTIQGGVLARTGTGRFVTLGATSLLDGTAGALTNQAEIDVVNSTALDLAGTIANSGTLALQAGANLTELIVSAAAATLTGAGQLVLTDSPNNVITGAAPTDTLVNIANTISGAGRIGAGQLTLINRSTGLIDGNGANALAIDTGAQAVTNAGKIEATGAGGVTIASAVVNTGVLEVDGGNLTASGAVSGAGTAVIHAGTITFASTFAGGARFTGVTGTLALAQSQTYAGVVSGFSTHGAAGADFLDLQDIAFVGAGEGTFKGTSAGGILTVTDGTHVARISLAGNYTLSGFTASSDGRGGTLITLGARAPVAVADAYSTQPGAPLTVAAAAGVLANDIDPNGLALAAILTRGGAPANGTLTLNANGSFTYTPNAGFKGLDSFTYVARDADGSSAPVTVSLAVGVAGPPLAQPDAYKDGAGQTLAVTAANGVLANDTDQNGLPMTATLAPGGGPAHGVLKLNADGSFTYTPTLGFAGTDTFQYIAGDSLSAAAPTTVTLTIAASPPTAKADAYKDAAGQALTVAAAKGVLANDTDPNGLGLTATLATGPAHGTLVLNADGSFTYTPTLGFAGRDSFTYTAGDSLAASTPATVTLTVTASPPTTTADAYGDAAGHGLSVTAAKGVLANDTDPNGLPLTATLAAGPAHGSLVLNADGSFTYTPTLGFAGKDSFTYVASDSLAASAATTVTLTVTASPPATTADAYGDAAGHGISVTAAKGVLANDTDPNGLPLTAALAVGGQAKHGTVTLFADGSFTYTPTLGFAGTDTFTYIARDSLAVSAPTTVTLTVTASAPTGVADAYGDAAGHALTVAAAKGVLANDTDPNGLPLTATLSAGPAHGTLTLNADGSFTYTPTLGFAGKDTFTYVAADSLAAAPPTTVTLTVTASPPTATADAYGDGAGHALIVTAAKGVLANDTDPNGLPLTATLAAGPAHGTLTLNADGSFTYTPTLGFAGKDSFAYVAADSLAAAPPTTVTLTVTASAPTATADAYGDGAGHALTVTAAKGVLANDADNNGLPLTATLAAGPTHGTLTLNKDGSFTYTPVLGFAGKDSFTYVAADSLAAAAPATVSLTVNASPPVTNPDTYSAIANQALTVDAAHGVLANDSDPNGLKLTAALAPGGTPEFGTVTLNADGSFTYILNSGFGGFSGVDTFSYIASDGVIQSAPTTVTIDVSNGAARVGASAATLAQAAAGLSAHSTAAAPIPHAAAPALHPLLAGAGHPALS